MSIHQQFYGDKDAPAFRQLWDRNALQRQGYKYTGISHSGHGFGFLRRVAIEFDVTLDSVTCFCVSISIDKKVETWEYYLRPNVIKGFRDQPLLPGA